MKPELVSAFENARYKIVNPEFEIRVREVSAEIDQLLSHSYTKSWALITPFNPGSQVIPPEENEERLRNMREQVQRFRIFESEGGGNDNTPTEKGFLILGIRKSEACRIGKKHGQDAIVFGYLGKPAEVLVLDEDLGRDAVNRTRTTAPPAQRTTTILHPGILSIISDQP